MPSIFTKIINGEIPATIVYQDAFCVAFRDLDPQAPVHVVIVPRQEVTGVAALTELGDHQHLLFAAKKVAEIEGVAESGFRLVINQGQDGGQSVDHLHVHLLAGRKLNWPPG